MTLPNFRSVFWKVFCAVVLAAILLVSGPLHAAEPKQSQLKPKVDFSRQIRPILSSKCFSCHGPDESQRQADLRFDIRQSALAKAIVPSKVAQSKLIQRITSDDPDERMPPADSKLKLTADEVALLKQWVAQGADYSVHWAFVKPKRPRLPSTKNEDWGRNEIDAFVLNRLETAGLQPSAEADKVTLIRRLSLDLTGLPPTIDEVDRFLSDKRPQAYEKLVDRLLASQHYGERMAQGWLDLARYGDTNGYENDSERKMWLYRDWVIHAFNTNMPFNRFTIEQIAGDLLPQADNSQKIASGFNRNTTYNEEGGSDPEEFLVVYAVERASTTATVFLSLTMGCAQCHEHKYDPISQQEFYQFYAFFNSVDSEKGAQGHDVLLPPLLRLPSKQQTADLNRANQELAELQAHITAEVTKIKVAQVKVEKRQAAVETKPSQPSDQKPQDEKVYFDIQAEWEQFEKKLETSKIPKNILELVKIKSTERNDEQKRQLRDYFVEHSYSQTKHIFEPLHRRKSEWTKRKDTVTKAIPTTMVMKEMPKRRPTYVLIRGDFQRKAEQVQPGVPAIFPPMPKNQPRNRLGLAYWLVDDNNPLMARVAINRFWKQFFGTGFVKTMDDFGVRGEFPSHPKLLDWLATEFIRTGWNVKALLKTIVMSASYRLSSRYQPGVDQIDRDNRLLSRQSRFRLSAEEIRDTALAISGLLNDEIGGESVFPYQPAGYYSDKGRWKWSQSQSKALYRRGLYTFWRRTTFYPSFQIFDAPSRETCTVDRPRTNTPLQALVTLNDPTFVEAARVFAARIINEGCSSLDDSITFAFRAAVIRFPDDREKQILKKTYTEQLAKYKKDKPAAAALIKHGEHPLPKDVDAEQLAAWMTVANVLLNLDETITRD